MTTNTLTTRPGATPETNTNGGQPKEGYRASTDPACGQALGGVHAPRSRPGVASPPTAGTTSGGRWLVVSVSSAWAMSVAVVLAVVGAFAFGYWQGRMAGVVDGYWQCAGELGVVG